MLDKIIDIQKFRKPEFTTEEEVWKQIQDLPQDRMLIITNDGKQLRAIEMRITRFQIKPQEL